MVYKSLLRHAHSLFCALRVARLSDSCRDHNYRLNYTRSVLPMEHQDWPGSNYETYECPSLDYAI